MATEQLERSSPLVECRGLDAGYGKTVVIKNLDLAIDTGRVLAVLGPNGSGKTTLIQTMAGLTPRLGGEVLVSGEVLTSGRPLRARSKGVVPVFDDRSLFTRLTVAENLFLACGRDRSGLDSMRELFPALEKKWDLRVGALSGGEQQMVAIARGLVQHPKVLLIDEMSMGLAPIIAEQLLPVVRSAAESGTAVLLVEQHVAMALEVGDDAVVLVHGEIVLSGTCEELRRDPDALRSAYLGTSNAVA